jgi:gamma-glutamyltranspeptidase/glutathione hydrolase
MKNISTTFLITIDVIPRKTINATDPVTSKAMVVSAREEDSNRVDIMKKEVTHLTLWSLPNFFIVAHPQAGNIGGGGFMVYRKANGETGSIDYREKPH